MPELEKKLRFFRLASLLFRIFLLLFSFYLDFDLDLDLDLEGEGDFDPLFEVFGDNFLFLIYLMPVFIFSMDFTFFLLINLELALFDLSSRFSNMIF